MGLPQRALYTIHETAARWGCTVYDIAGWAGIGTLKIVTGIPPVVCGDQSAGGLVEIQSMDIVPIFRNCGTGPQTAQLLSVRPLDSDEWLHIDEPESGVTVSVGDVMILGEDVRRFEETHDLFGRIEEGAGLGDDGDYDWAAMRIEITRRVYEQGLPASQAAWVRELQDWFSDRSVDGSFPDERSIRRRLRPVLIALKFKAKTS